MTRREQTDWSSASVQSEPSENQATTGEPDEPFRLAANSGFGFFLVFGLVVALLTVVVMWLLGLHGGLAGGV